MIKMNLSILAQPPRPAAAERLLPRGPAAVHLAQQARSPVGSAIRRAAPHRRQPVVAAAGSGSAGAAPPVTLVLPDGSTQLAMSKAAVVVGSGPEADVRVQGANVAAAHARLEFKGGRLFCTALAGDPDLLLAPTHCWLDGVELRPGVNYMVAPGARIGLGSADNCLQCDFQEGGSSAMAEMLMKGLAASASKEVQEKLGGL